MDKVRHVRLHLERESSFSVNYTLDFRASSKMTKSAFPKPQLEYISFTWDVLKIQQAIRT